MPELSSLRQNRSDRGRSGRSRSIVLARIFAVSLLLFGLALPIAADPAPDGLVAILAPGEGPLQLTNIEMLEAAGESGLSTTAGISRPPLHGALATVVGGLEYSPETSFWTLGSDSFTYKVDTPQGPVLQRVFVYAALHGVAILEEDFESGTTGFVFDPSFSPAVSQAAAIRGTWGLGTTLDTNSQGPLLSLNTDRGDGTPDSGGDCVRIIPPSQEGLLPMGEYLRLFAVGDTMAGPAVSVDVHDFDPLTLSATLVDRFDVAHSTQEFVLPATFAERQVQLDWWLAEDPGSSGGLMLWVDGDFVTEWPDPQGTTVIDNYGLDLDRVDLVTPSGSVPGSHALPFDDLAVRAARSPANEAITGYQAYETLLQDSFQDGSLSGWANASTTSTLTVQDAQLAGNWHLAVDFSEPYPRFLVDNSPDAEADYAARFRLQTHDLVMGIGEDVMIFAASHGEDADNTQIHVQVWLRKLASGFQARVSHKPLGQPRINTPWQDLVGSEHVLAVEWLAATRGTAANGRLRLWLDGEIAGELTGLTNGDLRVESVRLGAKNVDPLTGGMLYLDDFESWRPALVPQG